MKYRSVARDSQVDVLLAAGAPVAIGVSGGKDSQAAAIATIRYLDALGHRGDRVLIHSDLGVVEWNDSIRVCRELAEHLRVELVVVRRKAGDMMDRWEARWASSVRRYAELETVTVVLPWSTPSMRFCTSELKTQLIGAALRRRYGRQMYVNVTGVRRQESAARAKGAVASLEAGGRALGWRPLSDWSTDEVFAEIASAGLVPHPGYAAGMSRISCRFCIMSNAADLEVAVSLPESHELYRRQVALEARSTFAFQGSKWLGDVAPHLLTPDLAAGLVRAKAGAAERVRLEKLIPKELLFLKGKPWPSRLPTAVEAAALAETRRQVGALLGIEVKYQDAVSVMARYESLMALQAEQREAA